MQIVLIQEGYLIEVEALLMQIILIQEQKNKITHTKYRRFQCGSVNHAYIHIHRKDKKKYFYMP